MWAATIEPVSDPGAFYSATATILSAALIAGVLELRWYRDFLSDYDGRLPLIYRVMLTAFAALLGVCALALGGIASAALSGPERWYEDPERLVALTSGAVTVAVVLPLGTYFALVWGAWKPTSQSNGDAPAAIVSSPHEVEQPPKRAPVVIAVSLVLAAVVVRRFRSGGD